MRRIAVKGCGNRGERAARIGHGDRSDAGGHIECARFFDHDCDRAATHGGFNVHVAVDVFAGYRNEERTGRGFARIDDDRRHLDLAIADHLRARGQARDELCDRHGSTPACSIASRAILVKTGPATLPP